MGAGYRLAGRYRLVRPVPAPGHGLRSESSPEPPSLWLAHDEVLARPVAAKLLRTDRQRTGPQVQGFLRSAASAGAVSHPVLVRVYDADEEPGAGTAFVISEWVDGPSLASVLADEGPWEPDAARTLVTDVLDALVTLHDAGLVHGRVHPGNLVLGPDGGVRLTDVGLGTALPDRSVPSLRATDTDPRAGDVRDLAAVLYALLTARWPTSATPQPAAGVPAAPVGRDGPLRGRLTGPSQIRAGVPRALNAVVVRALDPVRAAAAPALTTLGGLCDALGGTPAAAAPRRRGLRLPGGGRRRLPLLGLVLLALLCTGAYTVSRPPEPAVPASSGSSTGPSGGSPAPGRTASRPLALAATAVRDFDPPPGDGRERPGAVAGTTDEDLGTAWETEHYTTWQFGGLKSGVGLLVDLGEPTTVGRVELLMPRAGTTVELRAADGASPPAQIDGCRVLDTTQSGPATTVLTAPAGTSARYYVVWIAGLPAVADHYAASIASLRLFAP